MLAILTVIAPIFAVMGMGYGAVYLRLFPAAGIRGLIDFVNNFATPCLLFHSLVTSDFAAAFNIAIIAPFYIGALICFASGIFIARKIFTAMPGEAVSIGFAGTFTNTVLVGLPIVQRAYGVEALPVVLSIIGLHGAILLSTGMITMELMRRNGQPMSKAIIIAMRRVGSSPLIWGIAAGLVGYSSSLVLIEPVEAFFIMMRSAVVPVALFGIGGALNEFRLTENWREALVASSMQLIIHPAIAYMLMIWLLHMPVEIARYGILLAAMPAGINVYIFATQYNRAASIAASTILITTAGSAATIAIWLYILSL